MDPVATLGAVAASSQFAGYGLKGLVSLIQLVSQLRDTPSRTRELLGDVQDSITRLTQLEQALQDPSSDLMQGLDTRQIEDFKRILRDCHNAAQELQDTLTHLLKKKDGTLATGKAKAWKTVVSVTKTKQIEDKLQRIQRLHNDILLQLQVTDLELQAKISATSEKTARSVEDGLRAVQHLDSRVASLDSTAHSTNQKLQLIGSEISGIQHNTDLIVARDTKLESSLRSIQPTLDSLEQGHNVAHAGIDRTLEALNDNVSTSREILAILTDHRNHFALTRDTHNLSSADKADIVPDHKRTCGLSERTARCPQKEQ